MEDDSDYHIEVSHRDNRPGRIGAEAIRQAVRAALGQHGCRKASISVAVVDDEAISRLNEIYLDHEGPTDVLSFDLGSDPSAGVIDGEIVVSWETADGEASRRAGSVQAELLLYVIHGTLHLLGFDDSAPEAAVAMHEKEDALLESLGYGVVYAKGREGDGRR